MVDRPDVVLIGIPLFVASGYALSTLAQLLGAASALTRVVQAIGYLAALVLIYWTVAVRIGDGGN